MKKIYSKVSKFIENKELSIEKIEKLKEDKNNKVNVDSLIESIKLKSKTLNEIVYK